MSALVRLAHKYHIQPVQDQAIAALRLFDFTDDFDTYFTGVANNTRSLMTKDAHAIGAVNIARLTDTPSMLPFALYHCAYLGGALLEGWKRRDGTVEQLSHADLQRCIDGRVTLAEEQRILIYQLLNEEAGEECLHPWICAKFSGLQELSGARRLDGYPGPNRPVRRLQGGARGAQPAAAEDDMEQAPGHF